MKQTQTILLLIISNIFMTLAWYLHLKLKQYPWFANLSLITVIIFSWGIALFEYMAQVPANKYGFIENGGPFNIWQLKIIQEVLTLIVFTGFSVLFFKSQPFKLNYIFGFVFMILAVYFFFKD